MFYSQRVVDIADGLPKWSGMSGMSDLIEDSPAADVKKRKREIEEEENGKEDGEEGDDGGHKEKEVRKTYNLR